MPRHASTKARPRKSQRRPASKKLAAPIQPVKEQKPLKVQRPWPRVIALLALLILIGLSVWYGFSRVSAISANAQAALSVGATATATAKGILPPFSATPTPVRTWQTFLTFTGGGASKTTQTFDVPDDWQITWTCQGLEGADKPLYIAIYNANGSLYSAGEQATCLGAQKVNGYLEEQKSGKVYLKIQSQTSWVVNVQKIK